MSRSLLQKLSILSGFCAVCVSAQSSRTYVSGTGDDANPCSRTAPCLTFAGAIAKTFVGGEINVLDDADFRPVTITKSITIDGGDAVALVTQSAGNAITINSSTAVVTLRSLNINGVGTGAEGVHISSAASVRIEKSRIYGFTSSGVKALPSTGSMSIAITDSVIRNCSGAGAVAGLTTDGTSGTIMTSLNHVEIHACPTGLSAINSKVSARNFDFSSNTNGVAASGNSIVNLDSGVISYASGNAVSTSGTATIRLTNNTIENNGVGLVTNGGSIVSFNNNRIKGNTTDGNPTTTYFQR